MKNLFSILFISAYFASCSGEDDNKIQSADEVLNSNKITGSKIYHNPVSADKPISTEEAAIMSFEEVTHDFGKVTEGDLAQHVYKFKNTGKAPLVITNASGSCGCTVPSWPKEPIAPGSGGEIKVSYNSTGKSGREEKEITVLANTIPNKTTLRISALVIDKP